MEADPYAAERERMVHDQMEVRGITNPKVLQAMRTIPRHLFVPAELRSAAYRDHPLPIGEGQTISQPYIVALMTQLLDPKETDTILEIGSGSGYQAAILGALARRVVTIERLSSVAERARVNLAALNTRNVEVIVGDGTQGYAPEAPYNGILITASTPSVPRPLIDQLAEDGRLVAPVGGRDYQELQKLIRRGRAIEAEYHGGVVFVPLIGEYGWEK
jgi:protein-L-isoaspartate(D-aspartate) O-methyltransferase